MANVFISYRRDDSAYAAQQIYDLLRQKLEGAAVVFDVDSVPPGADFRKYLNDQVSSCDILLGWFLLPGTSEREARRRCLCLLHPIRAQKPAQQVDQPLYLLLSKNIS